MMNFKIENKYLNITNYPAVEDYLESMARKGWLLSKLFNDNLFIFKKIEPEELDFAISPYEIESDDEFSEFENLCESVGWNFATKSRNFHVYYKEKGVDAVDIYTDKEDAFKLLKKMGNAQINNSYILMVLWGFLAWSQFKNIGTTIDGLKNGSGYMITFLLFVVVLQSVTEIVQIKKFIKINTKNIELDEEMEYRDSKFYFQQLAYGIGYLIIIKVILSLLHNIIFAKNIVMSLVFIPILIMLALVQINMAFSKPSKHTKRNKKTMFVAMTIVPVIMILSISIYGNLYSSNSANRASHINREKYKILLISDFGGDLEKSGRGVIENSSILIPKSYEYTSWASNNKKIIYLDTEYSKALTEGLASELVNRYKTEAAINESAKIIKADHQLWNADEAYLLVNNGQEIVVRKGKEVFMLGGHDFSDPEVIRVARESLGL